MSEQPLISDIEQRNKAVDPHESFICEAPAGSGKTQLLTERYLNLLLKTDLPENILAITFTRKAVAEMRARIVSNLEAALAGDEPIEDYKKKLWLLSNEVLKRDDDLQWNLLENTHRLQIKTFDSLCAQIANALPVQSKLGQTPEVTDKPDDIYRNVAKEFLATLEHEVPWADALESLLESLDVNYERLEQLLVRMLDKREQWLPHIVLQKQFDEKIINALERVLSNICSETVDRFVASIDRETAGEIVTLAAFAADRIDDPVSPLNHCRGLKSIPASDEASLEQWQGILSLLLTKDGSWRKRVDKRSGFPASKDKLESERVKEMKQRHQTLVADLESGSMLREQLLEIKVLPGHRYTKKQHELLRSLVQVLPYLVAHLTLAFKENNCIDFTEISARAREALGTLDSPTELALRLDHTIQHILIDEFQDTSSAQIELINQLTRGWSYDDGRTLFCVGDAMQAIYSFRGANVGLFVHALENGLENVALTPLRLTANFRSESGIVEWNNDCFNALFPKRNDINTGAVRFSESHAVLENNDNTAVRTLGLVSDHYEEFEAAQVVEEIKQSDDDQSIAVLVRNRQHAEPIANALSREHIEFRAVDIESLQASPLIQDLTSLTRALVFPNDRIAWLALLRTPWIGITLDDIYHLAQQGSEERSTQQPSVIEQLRLGLADSSDTRGPVQEDAFSTTKEIPPKLSSEGRKRLTLLLPVLEKAVMDAGRTSLRQWIENTWLNLKGPACTQSQSDLKNAERYFDLLDTIDDAGGLKDRHELNIALNGLYSLPAPKASDRIQIMTIHKAKGLEFDTVIIPSMHRKQKNIDKELLEWHERVNKYGEHQLLIAPINPDKKNEDPINRYMSELSKAQAENEKNRLLYVACTRARKKAHFIQQT